MSDIFNFIGSAPPYPCLETSRPLQINKSCNPEDHLRQNAIEIIKMADQKTLFPVVETWQKSKAWAPICYPYVGYQCNTTTQICDCPQGTEFDSDTYKCYIPPGGICTLIDIEPPGFFEQVTKPEYIETLARLLIHPVLLPVCEEVSVSYTHLTLPTIL